MRKYTALVLALVCMLSLIGCTQQTTTDQNTQINNKNTTESKENVELEIVEQNISIPAFSYAEDSTIYVEGEPGVRTSDFVNTSETDIDFENVVEVAKNECTIQWNTTETYFDTATETWKVVFSTGTPGGCQSVYMDANGRTVLIVSGE